MAKEYPKKTSAGDAHIGMAERVQFELYGEVFVPVLSPSDSSGAVQLPPDSSNQTRPWNPVRAAQ